MKRKTTKHATWKMTAIWIGMIMVAALGFGVYQYKTAGWDFSAMSASLTRVKMWISEHKAKSHAETKLKLLSKNNLTQPQPLHFEFYTALPNMQITTPDRTTDTIVSPVAMKPVLHQPVNLHPIKPHSPIVTADELEQELSGGLTVSTAASVKKEQFAIQLGVFGSIQAAQHYQETLKKSGLKALVSAFSTNKKNLYRVHLGPYTDKNQAKLTRQQLQAQGINGVIYTLNKR